jgi:hypothetical protein
MLLLLLLLPLLPPLLPQLPPLLPQLLLPHLGPDSAHTRLLLLLALLLPPLHLHLQRTPSTAEFRCSCSVSGDTRFTSNY